jgi:hypothetical protein
MSEELPWNRGDPVPDGYVIKQNYQGAWLEKIKTPEELAEETRIAAENEKKDADARWAPIRAQYQKEYDKYYNYFLALDNPKGRNSYLKYPYDGIQSTFTKTLDELRGEFVQLRLLYPENKMDGFLAVEEFFKNDETLERLVQICKPKLMLGVNSSRGFISWLEYNKPEDMKKIATAYGEPAITMNKLLGQGGKWDEFQLWLSKHSIENYTALREEFKKKQGITYKQIMMALNNSYSFDRYKLLMESFIKEVKKKGYSRVSRALCTNKTRGPEKITEDDSILTDVNGKGQSVRSIACIAEGGARRTCRKAKKSRKARKARKQSRRSK